MDSEGWKLDSVSYATAFRLSLKGSAGKTPQDLGGIIRERPAQLDCSFNLGAADFYPTTSGKERAAEYLIRRFDSQPERCVFMCDDDNDLKLAALVGKAFLPTVATESVWEAVRARPDKFTVGTLQLTQATEEMLDAAARHLHVLQQ